MTCMTWFRKEKTDKELQDELKALCDKVIAQQLGWQRDFDRYEELLLEIYKRGLVPVIKLQPRGTIKS